MAYAGALVISKIQSIKINNVEYKSQVWQATITPDTPVQTNRTFDGVDSRRDTTSYTLALTGYSRRITGGLGKALDDLSATGEPVEVSIQYATDTGAEIVTFDIIPVPVTFGGTAGEWLSFEQEFAINDAPVYTEAE